MGNQHTLMSQLIFKFPFIGEDIVIEFSLLSVISEKLSPYFINEGVWILIR